MNFTFMNISHTNNHSTSTITTTNCNQPRTAELQYCTNTANSTKHYSVTYLSTYLNLHMPKGRFSTFRDVLHEESTKWSHQCVLALTSLSTLNFLTSQRVSNQKNTSLTSLWSSGAPALGQTRTDLKIIQTTPYLTKQDRDCHPDACKPSNWNIPTTRV